MSNSTIKAIPVGTEIERHNNRIEAWFKAKELPKDQLVSRLKAYGLDEYEIEMVYQRFWEELKFKDIVKKSGWTSTGTASYVYRKILKKLRKRGFTFGGT